MPAKTPQALLRPSVLVELASQATMGVALGITFSLILITAPVFGVSGLIAFGSNPYDIMQMLTFTCALTFGLGATLTAIVFKLTEDT